MAGRIKWTYSSNSRHKKILLAHLILPKKHVA
jgi:hypothetical protein